MRILFLGNSFTFFHDLPDMVATLLQAEVGRNLVAARICTSMWIRRTNCAPSPASC